MDHILKKVSIIIPVFNVEEYIEECIESVLCQTYSNFELLLIDDGSQDGSLHICYQMGKKDTRIKVYSRTNSGVAATRNFGLKQAIGDYICFVDSDDVLLPDYLNVLVKTMEEDNADLVSCGYYYINEGGKITGQNDYKYEHIVLKENIIDCYMTSNLTEDMAWGKLYNKKIFEGLQYKQGILHEDSEIILRLLKRCTKVSFIKSYLYCYRIRKGSLMNYQQGDFRKSNISLKQLDVLDVYESMAQEVSNTKWQHTFPKKILIKCSELRIQSYTLTSDERAEAGRKIKCFYNKYKGLLWNNTLFSTKQRLSIWIRINFPFLYKVIRGR